MANENEMSDAELEAATAPEVPESAPVPPTNTEPESRRVETHTTADQSLDVDEYRPEPGTATFRDDRTGDDVELSGEAKSNPDLDTSNFEQEYPKRHVTVQSEKFEPQEGQDIEDVARQVLEGSWGSGQDRRILLDRYGYDPNEVQAKSVELLNRQKAEEDAKQLP